MASQPFAIVFTDLVDSTKIKSLLPAESLADKNHAYATGILHPHRERTSAIVASHGGTEVEIVGDSYVLRFSEVVDAARFAAEIQRNHALEPIATPLGPLRMRIGIHFGSPEEDPQRPGRYIGQELDYAARLMSLANGGQIVLSEVAATLLRQSLKEHGRQFAHGDRELKGIGRVPIFELLYDDKQPQALSQAALAPSNLPSAPRNVVGREKLLVDLRLRLHAGGVVILKSEGGMGKTTLALAASHAAVEAGELPGGVVWISCESKPTFDEFLRECCAIFFGDRLEDESLKVCSQRVREHLSKRAALLVLDNFETLKHDTDYLNWIALIRAPQRVLVTTRETPAGLQGAVLPVTELARSVALQLFKDVCESSGRTLQAHDQPLVEQLCAAVGDQPLAIEILATRAARLPLSTLAQRVATNINSAVMINDPTRPARRQSLGASFALSFEPLSKEAQELLIKTSFLSASISSELLKYLMPQADGITIAEELVDASLWRLTGDRFQSHALIRQAAWERLPASDAPAVRLQIANALSCLACEFNTRLQKLMAEGGASQDVLDLQESELTNFLLAAEIAQQAGNAEVLGRIVESLEDFWRVRGHWMEAIRVIQMALTLPGQQVAPARRAKLLQGAGRAQRHLMRFDEAEKNYCEALTLFEQTGNARDHGEALSELSRVYCWMDRLEESHATAARAVRLLREAGDGTKLATGLARLGVVLRLCGDLPAALECHQESLALCQKLRDRRGEGRSWGYLGDCYRHRQQWQLAEKAQQQGLLIAQELKDRRAEADTLLRIGKGLIAQRRWEEAEARLRESLATYRELGSQVLQARTLYFFAQSLQESGRKEAARNAIEEAWSLVEGQSIGWFVPRVEALRAKLMAP
jgi:class 3 adenylate cyclase/tetratricopeptide (TPR) repeat protein